MIFKPTTLNTTNIVIENANRLDYTKLNEKYKLIKYSIPAGFKSFSKKESNAFALFHNAYKNQIDKPYYFWSFQLGLYVLYPINESPQSLVLDFLKCSVTPENFSFDEVPLHVLIKLLVADYFYNEIEKKERFCQSNFFVLGKGRGKIFTTVQLTLRHDYTNLRADGSKEFYLIPQARTIIKQDKDWTNEEFVNHKIYYQEVIKDNTPYYRQVKSNRVVEWKNNKDTKDLFSEPDKTTRENMNLGNAKLDWHKLKNYEETRGFVAYKFQQNFCKFLTQEYEIKAKPKQQKFKTVKPLPFSEIDGYSETGLPIQELETIYVLDNRLINKETGNPFNSQPISSFVKLLNEKYSKPLRVKFEELPKKEITADKNVLVVQDFHKDDFKINDEKKPIGHLAKNGYSEDPKPKLYANYKDIVKQSISINSNNYPKRSELWTKYFDYQIEMSKIMETKLLVCFNELYLKQLAMKDVKPSPAFSLYFMNEAKVESYMFLYDYTLLYIEDKKFSFIDVAKNKKAFHNKLKEFGVQYREITQYFKEKYNQEDKTEEELDEKLSKTHFIISKSTIIEIEDTEERLLVNYQQIEKQGFSNKTNKVVQGTQGVSLLLDDNSYAVGSVDAMKFTIPRASKIKRLDFYKGKAKSHREHIVKMLTVEFVRNKQYTVYPYPYDLIRAFNENRKY